MTKDSHIKVKNRQIVLSCEERESIFPIEDTNSVMIENLQTTISTHTLSQLAEGKVLVFVCNDKHLPTSILMPFYDNFNQLLVSQKQIEMTKPFKNQLWQSIIKNKIENQARVLEIVENKDFKKVLFFASQVQSGDKTNQESAASSVYFKLLFGRDFNRSQDNVTNAALNYGYSIIRGFISREIAVHGLLPFLGIWHSNQLNNFNLADDVIEIFRPIVDLFVYKNREHLLQENKLTSEIKAGIYNIINYDVAIKKSHHSLSNAVDIFVSSLLRSIKSGKNELEYIKIEDSKIHRYE